MNGSNRPKAYAMRWKVTHGIAVGMAAEQSKKAPVRHEAERDIAAQHNKSCLRSLGGGGR